MPAESGWPDGRRAMVTGLGAICSIGEGVGACWEAILAGAQGARPVRSFDTAGLRNRVGCEVDDRRWRAGARAALSHLPRASRLGATAAAEALADAGLAAGAVDAVCVGTTTGDLPQVEDDLGAGEPRDRPALEAVVDGSFAGRIATAVGVEAPAWTVATSCSAGNIAISRAVDLVRGGRAERVLVGGADAFSKLAFIGFSRIRGMAPERCAPFARGRRGMLLGEGAAFLVVESLAAAERRGAVSHAEIAGYGLSCDAFHPVTPVPDGDGAARAMLAALDDAGLSADAVDYVSAHGTGTPQNDLAESRACRRVFGDHRPWVSSLKALVGHCLGAAGALEALASVQAIRHGRPIPAWNVDRQDPDCDVRLPLPGGAGEAANGVDVILSNALAFGGNNSCLALRRPS